MIKGDLSMMNTDIYTKAYEAGKQDVLSEVKLCKYILYADIVFDEENSNDTDSRYFRAGLVL